MSVVEYKGCKIWIDIESPKTLNELPTNIYRDAETGEEYDIESLPPRAKGHTYTVTKTELPLGQKLGYKAAVVENKFRAWDEESYPVLKQCRAESSGMYLASGAAKRIYNNNPLPLSSVGSTVVIPEEAIVLFLKEASSRGWEVECVWWTPELMKEILDIRLRLEQEDAVMTAPETVRLEHFGRLIDNRYDPYFMSNPKEYERAAKLVRDIRLHVSAPDGGNDYAVLLEYLLRDMRSLFTWASAARATEDSIKINLIDGVITLGKDSVSYEGNNKKDSVVTKGTTTRLGKLFKRKTNSGD